MSQDSFEPDHSRDIDYGKIAGTILSRWYWIAACVIVALLTARLYLMVVHPRYSSTTSLMLTEPRTDINKVLNADDVSAKSTLETFNLTQSATFIITSEAFLNKVVQRLNYRYSFFQKDRWSTEELYPESPFTIDIIRQDSLNYYTGMFKLVKLGNGEFSLQVQEGGGAPPKTYHYGDVITAPGLRFRILKSFAVNGEPYYFRFHTRESLLVRISNNLGLDPQNVNILALTETDTNPWFAANVLNAITAEYVVYEASSRNQQAIQRLRFIDHQLDTIGRKVNDISNAIDSLKRRNNIANNLPVKMQADIAKLAQYEGQRSILDLERLNIMQFEEQALSNGNRLLRNFGLEGSVSALLGGLISQYNDQIRERETALEKYRANSDPVKAIDKKLSEIRVAILNNIQEMKEQNTERQRYYDNLIGQARAEVENVPAEAKDYVRLQTEYEINRKLFTNFTEERFKSRIELAAMAPTASVIYEASPSMVPVFPVSKKIYMLAILAGGAIGLGLILLARLVNRRLQDIASVIAASPVPVLGLVRRTRKKLDGTRIAFLEEADTRFAESVREVRTTLLNTLQETGGKVIVISSEVSGEGRTFTAMNLAASLVQLEKRVIVIDADLRKPSPEKYSYAEELGLSAYLINFRSMLSVIRKTDTAQLDVVPSGVAPAQPGELLQSAKMRELIAYTRSLYDYVIVDTSPVGAFADAIPLFALADLNLYVVRGGFSGFNAIPVLQRIIGEYRLKNFGIVLNGFKRSPLYQPFTKGINTDIYFNATYDRYTKKYNDIQADRERWEQINRRRP